MSRITIETTDIRAAVNALPDTALIDISEVVAYMRCSRSRVEALIRDGAFPPALRLGERVRRWRLGDIRAFVDARIAQAAKGGAGR